jgi:hypothetical protein
MSPAAEDSGDAEARETEAIREYATWSSRVRTLVIAVTVVVGLAVATGAFYGVLTATDYAFRVSLYAAGATWAVVTMIGVAAGRLFTSGVLIGPRSASASRPRRPLQHDRCGRSEPRDQAPRVR